MSEQPKRLKRAKPRKPISEHRRGMQKAYTHFYRRKLKSTGSPDRREIAEALMITVLRCTKGSEGLVDRSVALKIIDQAGAMLRSKLNSDGSERYKRKEIIKRLDRLLLELDQP
jgi:hypothetical protein